MAVIADNGKIVGFNKSEKDLEKEINAYKQGVESGKYVNPCPPQFYAVLGIDRDIVATVIRAGSDSSSTWYNRARMLKNTLQWLRSEMSTELHWTNNKSVKTMFLLKQDWGDGIILEDKPDPKAKKGNKAFNVSWGSPSTEDNKRKRK